LAVESNLNARVVGDGMKNRLAPAPEIGTVPQAVFAAIAQELTEALGPMARFVLRDSINSLGESEGHFPKAKLATLLRALSYEIVDDAMRRDFQRAVSRITGR
jgi:hypothetical protein